MSAKVPHHKGTGVLPVVAALKAHPRGPQSLPAALRHYLKDQMVATEWYPEDDLQALLRCLAEVLERDGMRDVWDYFGRTAAQRDLKGSQAAIPTERRVKKAGLYRPFAGEDVTLATLFLRVSKLWTLYYDAGTLVTGRSASDEYSAIVRLTDFSLPTPDLTRMHLAYTCEYARILGINITGRVAHALYDGDHLTEWHYGCERTVQNLESLALLPLLP
jgi:hypothetical protein